MFFRRVSQTFLIAFLALSSAAALALPGAAQGERGPVSVAAVQVPGASSLVVSGKAPPNATVHIMLFAQLSKDLPTAYIGSADTVAASNGTYATITTLAPDYNVGSTVLVRVSSASGGTASTTYVLGVPNPGISPNSDITVPTSYPN